MEFKDFLHLVARKRKTVYGVIAIFLVLAAGLVAFQRFKYSSKSQVLVVQEYKGSVDAYTASKSSEYLSGVLASVIPSNSFYTKVMNSGFGIDSAYYGQTPKDQMKRWEQTVQAKSINDSGIIAIVVYHPDRAEAEKTVRAINYVLMTQHTAYHGSGDAVKVRLIDQPVTSSFPVQPNVPLIAGLAIMIGAIVALIYIYLGVETPKQSGHGRLSFEDVMLANASAIVPDYQRPPRLRSERPRYTDVQVRGQLPEEAIGNLSGDMTFEPQPHQPHQHQSAPRQLSHYGQHESIPNEYLDDDLPPGEIDPERLVRQGSMRNILG